MGEDGVVEDPAVEEADGRRLLRALLPHGDQVSSSRLLIRHRLLTAMMVVLGIAVAMIGLLSMDYVVGTVALTLTVAAGLTATALRHHLTGQLVVAVGLMLTIAGALVINDGVLLWYVMFPVLLGFVALYQHWVPLVAAFLTAVASPVVILLAVDPVVPGGTLIDNNPAAFVAAHTALLLLAGVGAVVWWAASEEDHRVGRASSRELVDVQRRMLAQMQATEQLKDDLLAVVSHEFRTPLTSILGFAQTLRQAADTTGEAPPAEMVKMATQRIEQNGLRLSRLIGNMLAATMEVQPQTQWYYPLRATMEQITDELSTDTDGSTPVLIDVPEDMTARMSREHLRLLLGNLIDNGMKFADPGTPLRIMGRFAGDEIALTFTNAGPEIPEDMREQVFARFVQVDTTDTRPHDGAGLGLHVVRRLCDAHGGALELRNQSGLVVLGITLPAGPRERVGVVGRAVDEAPPPGPQSSAESVG